MKNTYRIVYCIERFDEHEVYVCAYTHEDAKDNFLKNYPEASDAYIKSVTKMLK